MTKPHKREQGDAAEQEARKQCVDCHTWVRRGASSLERWRQEPFRCAYCTQLRWEQRREPKLYAFVDDLDIMQNEALLRAASERGTPTQGLDKRRKPRPRR